MYNLILVKLSPGSDGIPPYKLGSKKQLQREMHRNMRMNGQVSLPPFPVSVPSVHANTRSHTQPSNITSALTTTHEMRSSDTL